MDLKAEIAANGIIVVLVPKERYHEEVRNIARAISQSSKKTCYVCLNDPYNFVRKNLEANGIAPSQFFFIDTLTKKIQDPPKVEDCIFVSAPNALTELSLAFSKAMRELHCDGALFDTLSSLSIYENPHSIIQFTHNVITKLRVAGGKAVLIALKDDVNSDLLKDLYMFVDKVVDISTYSEKL